MPENGRKALHAYLSDDAHDRWHSFAADQGVSVSAVLEALAGELQETSGTATMAERLDEVVRAARKIDAQRRRRTRADKRL